MNCEQARELAALADSGDISPAERRGLAAHTAGCAECRAEAVALEGLCGRLAAMRQESAPEHIYAAVRARVLAEVHERRRPGWLAVWPAFAAVMACSLILLVTLHRELPVVVQPAADLAVAVPVAGVQEEAPAVDKPSPRRRPRKRVARPEQIESAEPLVVHMFTDDPDVVIYWIADTRVKRPEKEIIQ